MVDRIATMGNLPNNLTFQGELNNDLQGLEGVWNHDPDKRENYRLGSLTQTFTTRLTPNRNYVDLYLVLDSAKTIEIEWALLKSNGTPWTGPVNGQPWQPQPVAKSVADGVPIFRWFFGVRS